MKGTIFNVECMVYAGKEEEKRKMLKRSAELLQEKTHLENRTKQLNEILAVSTWLPSHILHHIRYTMCQDVPRDYSNNFNLINSCNSFVFNLQYVYMVLLNN